LAGTGDVVLVVLARTGLTNSATTLDLFLPTSGDRPSYGAMVERRDGRSWLRDDDDDEATDMINVIGKVFYQCSVTAWSFGVDS